MLSGQIGDEGRAVSVAAVSVDRGVDPYGIVSETILPMWQVRAMPSLYFSAGALRLRILPIGKSSGGAAPHAASLLDHPPRRRGRTDRQFTPRRPPGPRQQSAHLSSGASEPRSSGPAQLCRRRADLSPWSPEPWTAERRSPRQSGCLAAAISRAASRFLPTPINPPLPAYLPEPYDDKVIVAIKRPDVVEWRVTAYDADSFPDQGLPPAPEPK